MVMVTRLKISKGGQVSVPAAVRKRWGTSSVIAEDHGDRVVLRPASDDPLEAAKGSLEHLMRGAPPAERLVRDLRMQDVEAESGADEI